MTSTFKLVKLDHNYCDYLRKFDYRVMYNAGIKELRPFIGVLFKVDNFEYFAPLSSPKPKHKMLTDQMDLVKINNGIYGVINLNNMIPVNNKNYEVLDLDKPCINESEKKRQILLKAQLQWLNDNNTKIKGKAIRLYNEYKNNKLPDRIKNRCCNYILLEDKCKEYNKQNQ